MRNDASNARLWSSGSELRRRLCTHSTSFEAKHTVRWPPKFEPVSTTGIVKFIRAPQEAPLRVDFGGGWLDVPRFSRPGSFIVNCAISPTVSLREWPYERNAGLGGSGAWALLNGRDGVTSELDLGVGWQDPAIITEGGLCVWKSGLRPMLELKHCGDFLQGRMALFWTGTQHSTPGVVNQARDYDGIVRAGELAREGVWAGSIGKIAEGVRASYAVQRGEGMEPLPGETSDAALAACRPLAWKYCGGGFGGYAVYIFSEPVQRDAACRLSGFRPIEPYVARSF
jgi:hypothetical protein